MGHNRERIHMQLEERDTEVAQRQQSPPPSLAQTAASTNAAEDARTEKLQQKYETILASQRALGNQATIHRLFKQTTKPGMRGGRLPRGLFPTAAKHVIQRFETDEHRSLGVEGEDVPESGLFPGSPRLSYGEIIALSGDFYRSYDQLASPYYVLEGGALDHSPDSTQRKIAELNRLKHLMDVQADARARGDTATLENMDVGVVPDIDAAGNPTGTEIPGYDPASGGKEVELALGNFVHFSYGGENINAWKQGHKQAMEEAFRAGLNDDPGGRIRAMARNAASNHFLTDAFSSGHMRVPRRPIDTYYSNLSAGAVDGIVDALIGAMPGDINFKIPLSELSPYLPDGLPTLPDIPINIPLPFTEIMTDMTEPLRADLRPFMHDTVGPILGGLVSKWLHDKDNVNGLWVTNPAGERWKAWGDNQLDHAGDAASTTTNRAEAEKAVHADVAEINKMFDLGKAQGARPTPGSPSAPGAIPANVHFGFDQPHGMGDTSVLSGSDQAGLDSLAAYLNANEGVTVEMVGWADSRGAVDYNVKLAIRRISSVKTYLLGHGVKPEKIGGGNPMGEPIVPTTAANHAEFRRVDLQLTGTPTPAVTPPDGNGAQPQAALPPEIEGPYGAEQFVPTPDPDTAVNAELDPYEWCDPGMDQTLKNQVAEKARDMLKVKAKGFIAQHLPANKTIDIEIPVPLIENPHVRIDIPLRQWASHITDAVDPAVDGVVTDGLLTTVLNGACGLAESVSAVEGGEALGNR